MRILHAEPGPPAARARTAPERLPTDPLRQAAAVWSRCCGRAACSLHHCNAVHELAIAELVADIARDHAAGRRVRTVRMRVGHLRQVVPAALEQGFALVVRGTPLEGAALAIEPVPIAGRCRRCDAESEQQDFPLRCPRCGSLALRIVRGEELQVDALELEDEPAPDRASAAWGRARTREVTA